MPDISKNPFSSDPDRAAIWEMLVDRDIIAFCQADWSLVENDFVAEGFMGINGQQKANPDDWRLTFPNLESYREEWLIQAIRFKSTVWRDDPLEALHKLTTLEDIDINADVAVAHKKFDGHIIKKDGSSDYLNWQTLYRCRKIDQAWKIAGFTGYIPYPLGATPLKKAKKSVPEGASQHVTAGPYSPVLEIDATKLVVISGQAALDHAGNVLGDNIEEQTKATLENCKVQLASAGCTLADVFKVNVFLTDLDLWPRFNAVYKTYFPDPKPVRTAVQTPLLMTFLVEIELWAVK